MGFEGNIEVNVLDNRKSFRVGSLWTGSYCERVNQMEKYITELIADFFLLAC